MESSRNSVRCDRSILSQSVCLGKMVHRMIGRGPVVQYWFLAECTFPKPFPITDLDNFNPMVLDPAST